MHAAQCDVVGVGANSVDLVTLLPAYPQSHGEHSKMRIGRQAVCCGGQMATALAACTALGLRARYVGVTGTDENGRRIRDALARRQVDLSGAVIRDAPNRFAIILVDETSGDRIVLWNRDERLNMHPRDIDAEVIRSARLLHVDDEDEAAAIHAARLGRESGIPVTSDLDRLTDRTGELVAAVTIPIFAEHLPLQLTGARDHETALRQLRTRHAGLLVITLGTRGAVALDGDRFIEVPGFAVDPVDTTGAGDVFRAGFIYGLLLGWETERVLRFANAAAAASCTRLGAMDGVPSLEETARLAGEARLS